MTEIDKKFKSKLSNYAVKPSIDIWDKIEDELDSKPAFFAQFKSVLPIAASLAVGFLVAFLIFNDFDKSTTDIKLADDGFTVTTEGKNAKVKIPVAQKATAKITALNKKGKTKTTVNTDNQILVEEVVIEETAITTLTKSNNSPKQLKPINKLVTNEVASAPALEGETPLLASAKEFKKGLKEAEKLEEQGFEEFKLRVLETPMMSITPMAAPLSVQGTILGNDASEKSDNRLTKLFKSSELQTQLMGIRGFSVGPTYAVNNTWILNKGGEIDKDSELKEVTYKPTFGQSYGVRFGYDFNHSYGIGIDWIINSEQGQKYLDINKDMTTVERRAKLKYMHVPVTFKYKWSKMSAITSEPVVLNYHLGVQYGYLKSAQVNVNSEVIEASDILKKHELGIVFGLDYDFYLNKSLFLTMGARGSYGSDIKAFPLLVTDETQKSNNLLLGLSAGLNYKIGK